MNPFIEGSLVKVISLDATRRYIGLDGDRKMKTMCNDGKVYKVVGVINDLKVKLNNGFYYMVEDLKKDESPYKESSTVPKLFNVENLLEV